MTDTADASRVLAWMRDPNRKPAQLAFTEGPERQADYWIEIAQSEPSAQQYTVAPLTDEMIELGGEEIYGHPRHKAVEWAKEDKFDSCCDQARRIYLAMTARTHTT